MPPFSENLLVEQPAIELFRWMEWETASAAEETFGANGSLGRETKSEVVLVPQLHTALERLNPGVPAEAITAAIETLMLDRSAMLLPAANREVYKLLKEGVLVTVRDGDHHGQKQERVRVIDWETPQANDFLLLNQMTITGTLYTCRPDLIGFVNGLPLVVIELKNAGVPARAAFDDNLTHYKAQIPALFWFNALMIASNGTDSRVGSLTADWDRFFEWKRIESEDEKRRVSMETMLRGTCDKTRLLDIVENFTLFSEAKEGIVKIIGQNHQVLGVNNAIASTLKARDERHGRGGVFWQTQGSGKSYSMVFFAQKMMRKQHGNWTFVIVTDRVELDDQIAKTFKATGAVSETESKQVHADSGSHLRELLQGNHRYVFTLIQKFQSPEPLNDRSDIIVITDEAHRSQYDTLALNMRSSLPNATFLAFTGTPLIAGEERTKDVFGDYVSIYDFQQSMEDGATVPLFYENRTPELQLVNPDLNEQIYDLVEDADLDPEQEKKLERELSRQYHLLTRDDRLETIAKDVVRHFLGRGFAGKAMVVAIDKATALRMYDKVRKYWNEEAARVDMEVQRTDLNESQHGELWQRQELLKSTDMALIVSPAQNEIAEMQKLGLDIAPHRKRMKESQPGLDERFKDAKDPLRIVFVCAMWLTGFDVPSCSTIYLDKPIRNHTLMQTIARANRVYPGKHSGVIVDYANVFASLEKALAIYGAGKDGKSPVKDIGKLVADLAVSLEETRQFCVNHGVSIDEIAQTPIGLERLARLDDAVNALISPDAVRRDFQAHERLVNTLYNALKPDKAALNFTESVLCLSAIAEAMRAKLHPDPVNISAVMADIGELLDTSITGVSMPKAGGVVLDLSKIDFDALQKKFTRAKHKNTDLEVLKAAVRVQLEELVRLNKTRVDFRARFEQLIEDYNAGSLNIEELFRALVELSRSLTDEEKRHVRENLSEEELVIFDILTRPAPDLSTEERAEVKRVARYLLERLKNLLVLDWRKTRRARASVEDAIKDLLDEGLPRAFSKDLYEQKCSAVFEHFYENYPDRDLNVYQ
ncbi:type I restriction enzyme, R subunit [Bryocella elongata]|uniref:Type I restriction enzyme endonuclease subunit n=1 Tax=Bryocella elongata TaxID=863522 RepID=A0A1H6AF41_9BACT|nr:type I restriction endonuclease subunit R [Bryocella elongata]SEG46687.1 type I restriction enzyme, R subunit [Bryocella elongata]